jgi:hypothetical protein
MAAEMASVARLARTHTGSRVVKDAYDAMVERNRNAWKKERTPAEREAANRASVRAMFVDQALRAQKDGGKAAYKAACEAMVEQGINPPTMEERRAWRYRAGLEEHPGHRASSHDSRSEVSDRW